MGMLCKTVSVYLSCKQTDKDGKEVEASAVFKQLFDLRYQTRQIKNKAIQLCWEWNNFASDYCKLNGEYPKTKDTLNYVYVDGYVYDKLKSDYDLSSSNLITTIKNVCGEFKNSKSDILKGNKSIISYKLNQPLDLHNDCIKLEYVKNDKGGDFYIKINLFKTAKVKELNYKNGQINFRMIVKDNSTRTILERCFDGIYKISASQLIYDDKKKKWKINLSYKFESVLNHNLEKDKILGVDMGIVLPICASVNGSKERLTVSGGEIEEFRRRVEARKKSLGKQTKYCGDGRIGHGRNTRCKPVYKIEDKIARFRDTTNHKYSREVINYAVKNNCGVIQMENLEGINTNNTFLKNWSYFDLQTKIKYKAEEVGIDVVFIEPKYTSQRCSKCGFIDKENRQTQARFKCCECGFEENADYNASQNIAIKDIDKIISKYK